MLAIQCYARGSDEEERKTEEEEARGLGFRRCRMKQASQVFYSTTDPVKRPSNNLCAGHCRTEDAHKNNRRTSDLRIRLSGTPPRYESDAAKTLSEDRIQCLLVFREGLAREGGI